MSLNPADSEIFGGLFGTDEMRALFSDRTHLQYMLDVEAALARAESKLGLVPANVAAAISAAARVENIAMAEIAAGTRRAGVPVAALVKELGRVAGDEAARYIHLGATTQDILDTALVLQVREAARAIRRDLIAVARALADQAHWFGVTPMAARTHLQQAVPTTFGFKCATWANPLADHVERLDQALSRILVVQLGGAAGTLAALGQNGPAVADALAKELGLGEASIPWHSARDRFAEAAAVLALLCGSLSKFALDITLLMQTEVAEVSEPYEAGRAGSSTMPQKRNPVASECIIAAARGVHALAPMMFTAMAHDHERATGAWQSEQLALPQCFALTAGALAHALTIAMGITVDTEQMRRNFDAGGGLIMAEAVVTGLLPAMGRAKAEAAVERACSRAIESGITLASSLRADPELAALLSGADIERLTDPSRYLGAAPIFVDRVVARIASLK